MTDSRAAPAPMAPRHWLVFGLVGLIWGSGFMWNKVGLLELPPFPLIVLRLMLGAGVLGVAVLLRRPPLPASLRGWVAIAVLGAGNIGLPHFLILWSQQHVDSTVAAILIATTPLVTLVVARTFLGEEPLTPFTIGGALLGFSGVVLLLSRHLGAWDAALTGQAGLLAATLCFAGSSVWVRHFGAGGSPLVQGFGATLVGLTLLLAVGLGAGSPLTLPQRGLTWLSIGALGLLNNGLAYVMFIYLIHSIGPTRSQMVSYLFPLVGVTLGVTFLGEPLYGRLVAGGALVIAGIALYNRARARPGGAAGPATAEPPPGATKPGPGAPERR